MVYYATDFKNPPAPKCELQRARHAPARLGTHEKYLLTRVAGGCLRHSLSGVTDH